MNKDIIQSNLQEASEELQGTLNAIRKDPEYDESHLFISMQHIYNHLNTAWNARSISSEQYMLQSSDDFLEWRQFPRDMGMVEEGGI